VLGLGKDVLRVGAVGCGNIFNYGHMPMYPEIEGARLVAFYDVDVKQAQRAKERYAQILQKVIEEKPAIPEIYTWRWVSPDEIAENLKENMAELRIYENPEDLLGNVDIVDVCTPPKWHVEYAVMTLERNANAMTEKPMGRTWWEARKVRDAVAKSRAFYQLNDDNVFHPRFQIFKNVIEEGTIGEVKHIWLYRGSHGPEPRAWFWNPEISGGGCLMDYGTHAVTTSWYLVGFDKMPVKVKSDSIKKSHKHRLIEGRLQTINVEDDAHVRILFEDPKNGNWITASIEATWSRPLVGTGDPSFGFVRIDGTEGVAMGYQDEAGNNFVKVSRTGFGDKLVPVPRIEEERESMKNEIRSFVKSIEEGRPSLCNEEIGIGTMEILGAAYLSEVKGRVSLSLEEFKEFCEDFGKKYPNEKAPSAIIQYLMQPYQ